MAPEIFIKLLSAKPFVCILLYNMIPEERDAVAPIAIVGMGCRFPGEATSPKAFFEMLSKGRAAWSEVPPDRYNMDRYWHPHNARAGTMTAKGGHFLKEDLGLFDAPV